MVETVRPRAISAGSSRAVSVVLPLPLHPAKPKIFMSEVVITKSPDSASMQLFNESVRLRPMTVEVDFVKPGETAPYITFTLQNATVSVFVMATHQSKESVSLSFSKVTYNKHDVGADVSRHLKTLTKGSRANPGIRRVR